MAADYADAIHAGFVGPVDILGYSMGEMLGLQLAADHPLRVRNLIVGGITQRLAPVEAAAVRRYMFDLSAHKRATGELRARATAKVTEIDGRIARLRAMRADLSAVIAAECDSLTDCSCGLGCPLPFVELSDAGTQR